VKLGKRKHVAIDYDREHVRVVVFEYARKAPTIVSMHTSDVPESLDVSDPAAMGAHLKTLVERLHLIGASALMCVGRARAVLKSLTLPRGTSADELASMVQLQVAQELPFGAEEGIIDFTYGPHWDTDRMEADREEGTTVLAAAVRLADVDAATQICETARLKLKRLGLRPYANVRAVYRCIRTEPGERILFVDLTASEAEIDVMRDETLEFSRSVTTVPGGATDPAAGVRRVMLDVRRCLQSFHAVQRGAEINACLVAGATGLENDLSAALAEGLGVPCQRLDPAGGFALSGGSELSSFTAALGLASGEAGDALPFDFLNPKRPAPARDMRKIWAGAAAGAAVVLIGGIVLSRSICLGQRRDVVRALEAENAALVKDNARLKKLDQRVQTMQDWRESGLHCLDQLAHLSNMLPGAEHVYLERIHCTPGKITLSGRAKSREVISAFAKSVMNMPGYEVRPKSTKAANDKFGYTMHFELEVLVAPEAEPLVLTERPVGRPADDRAVADPELFSRGRQRTNRPNRSGRRR